jgi:hypothetical protein
MSTQASSLGFALDPLIAEAKRRMRRRRLLVVSAALSIVGGVVVGAVVVRSHGPVRPLAFRSPTKVSLAKAQTCEPPFPGSSGPAIVLQGASAAASAKGGCVDGGIATLSGPAAPTAILLHIPRYAEPVMLSGYQGYLLAHAPSDGCAVSPTNPPPCPPAQAKSLLYVYIPDASDPRHSTYVVLLAQGLTKDQLIGVAESGLRKLPLSSAATS